MKLINVFYILILTILFACGQDRQYEGNDFQTSGDLTLTQNNHPHGYAQRECFYCHIDRNIHKQDRLHTNLLNLASQLVQNQGIDSCYNCHGTNGVQ